ncbi:MAG TPA: nucleotidyltransferase family protein [Thermoleophilaceae bacterium]|jgi:hypothetical protein|nr:nucleotidyltransferase family protein [Thermoleophilaceae bacterium]
MRSAAVTWPLSRRRARRQAALGEPERAAVARDRLESFVAGIPPRGPGGSPALERFAADLFGAFGEARIDALLLKGAALARLLYEPGERRGYVDVDVLVRPDHQAAAASVLAGLGYRNATELHGIDYVKGAVPSDTWTPPPHGAPYDVDVHRWLPGAQAPPETAWDALWGRRTSIELAGREIPVLARQGQALHLALHAAQHGPDFVKGLVELRRALDRWQPAIWRDAVALAEEVDALPRFAAGLRLVPDGRELVASLHLPVADAVEWEIGHRAERPRGTFHVEAFGKAESLRERIGLVRRALVPSRRWLEVEYHWAARGPLHLALGYALHLARTPAWLVRAWSFRRRARRAGAGN